MIAPPLILLVTTAMAGASSLDVELYHPRFGDGILGVDSVTSPDRGAVQGGALLQYTHDPLVLHERDGAALAVVRERVTLQVGGRWQPWRRWGLRASMPIVADWGGEEPSREATGVGVGDLWLGTVGELGRVGPVLFGAHLDVALPVGTRRAWRGEEGPRGVPGVLAEARLGRFRLVAEVSTTVRPPTDTGDDLVAGVDLLAHAGAAFEVWPERASIEAAVLDRVGLAGGDPAVEALVGLRVGMAPGAELDVHLGRGLTLGYGAPDYRLGAGLTFRQAPPRPPAPAPLQVAVSTVPEAPEPSPPPSPPNAVARVQDDQIVLYEPIHFEVGSDRLLPVSLPTLGEVATLLQAHPEIAQLVIEGHASDEGSFAYNYDLSLRRASAVFKELVLAGVHPDRLSVRAMGEVAPPTLGAAAGTDTDPARSRRVVFRIARRLQPGEPLPAYARAITLPWSGEAATLPEPPPPPPPPPPPVQDLPDPSLFEEDDE